MSLLGAGIDFPLEPSWSNLNLNLGTATYELGVLDKVGGQAEPWTQGQKGSVTLKPCVSWL